MPDRLKVGIVGCGLVAEGQHIPAFSRWKNEVTIEAVCDRNDNLVKQTALRCGIPGAYTDLVQMLEKEKLDIIDICTPPQTHVALALQALEHECHVLLEKPMAVKSTDCDQMIDAAKKHKKKICVVHNMLFNPPLPKARELVSSGAIGKFMGMRLFMSDPKEDMIMKKDHWIHKLPGGLIGETGPHAAYTSLAFLKKVKSVDVFAKSFLEHPWAPFDEFRIELEGEEAFSSIAISYASNRRNFSVDIIGSEKALYLDMSTLLMIRQDARNSMGPIASLRYLSGIAGQASGEMVSNALKVTMKRLSYGHPTLIAGFVNAILNDQQPPVTGEDGRETVRVVEMIVARLNQKYPAAYGKQPEEPKRK